MKELKPLPNEAKVLRLLATCCASNMTFTEGLMLVAEAVPEYEPALLAIQEKVEQDGVDVVFEKYAPEYFSRYMAGVLDFGLNSGQHEEILFCASALSENLNKLMSCQPGITRVGEVGFYRSISMLLPLGCPLLRMIEIASQAYGLPDSIAKRFLEIVMNGETLSSAMEKYPEYFSKADTIAVLSGEKFGTLALVCQELADIKEQLILLAPNPAPAKFVLGMEVERMMQFVTLAYLWNQGKKAEECFDTISQLSQNGEMKITFASLAEEVRSGVPIPEAMRKFPGYIPKYIPSLIEHGTKIENEPKVLDLIAHYLKWEVLGISNEIVMVPHY